jgi:hypothetical protein
MSSGARETRYARIRCRTRDKFLWQGRHTDYMSPGNEGRPRDEFAILAASARSLNFSPLSAITPVDLDARDRKRDSYRWPLFDGGPILRSGRQRSCGDEYELFAKVGDGMKG